MLNRRLLRIKAMQSIFAFRQERNARYQQGLDHIEEACFDRLHEIGKHEKEMVDEEQKIATDFYLENLKAETDPFRLKAEAGKGATLGLETLLHYHRGVEKDLRMAQQKMLTDVEDLHVRYIRLLHHLLDIKSFAKNEQLRKQAERPQSAWKVHEAYWKDPLLIHLEKNEAFQEQVRRYGIQPDIEVGRQSFRALEKEQGYLEYLNKEDPDVEPELLSLRFVVREVFFKKSPLAEHLEENDTKWAENHAILRTMLYKTLKELSTRKEKAQLQPIAKNWGDDKEFFKNLFVNFFKNEKYYENLIGQYATSWDKERIAETDLVLAGMALTELVSFPNIPVKVSINEYVEISKTYSTPKSWVFLNGILDKLVQVLTSKGELNKSGRGLINQ